MIPISLRMAAFGPYLRETVIDFTGTISIPYYRSYRRRKNFHFRRHVLCPVLSRYRWAPGMDGNAV